MVELGGEFRAVAAEGLKLRFEGVALAVLVVTPVDGSLKRIER